jgi:hypothetical protein
VGISSFPPALDDFHAFLLSQYAAGVLVGFHAHMLTGASYQRRCSATIRSVHTPSASKQFMCEFASHLYDSLGPLRALTCLAIDRSRRKQKADSLNADSLHETYICKRRIAIAHQQLNTDISHAQRFITSIDDPTGLLPLTFPRKAILFHQDAHVRVALLFSHFLLPSPVWNHSSLVPMSTPCIHHR